MRWEEMTSREVAALDRNRTVVVLPLGSVEQHGYHMPLGTDSMLAHAVATSAASKVNEPTSVVILPPPWYGFSAHHMRFAGSISLPAKLMLDLAEAIVDSVVAHGFSRILIVNGHGGNGGVIDVMAASLGKRHYGRARIAALTYFTLARDAIGEIRESKPGGTGHACEFETAMLLHLQPALVRMSQATTNYPDPGSSYLTTDLIGASAIRTYLDFKDLSQSGVLGDPSLASAEKGSRFFSASAEALAAFINDFATWTVVHTGPE
jgi:creatinine amidohydrolase